MESGRPSARERTDTWTLPPETTRLVVLGDPHGDLIGFEEVLAREERPGTAFVSVGDNVGYADGVLSSHFCALLAAKGVPSVAGNHEAWSEGGKLFLSPPGQPKELTAEAWAWLQALPHRLVVASGAAPDLRIHVVHTLPDWAYVNADNAERFLDLEGADVVLCGHTHRPALYTALRGKRLAVRQLDPRSALPLEAKLEQGARYVVDAGSLARPSRPGRGTCEERGTYAVLDLVARSVRLHSVDKRPRIRALMKQMLAQPPRRRRSPFE